MKKKRKSQPKPSWGPFTLPLPPAELNGLDGWLKRAATQMGTDVPAMGGHIRLEVRVGCLADVADERTLAHVVPAVMTLLDGEKIIEARRVADVVASWDRTVAPEHLTVTVAETTPPTGRIDAGTRQRVSEVTRRRWEAYRAREAA